MQHLSIYKFNEWTIQSFTFLRFRNGREDLNDNPKPGRAEAKDCAELVEKIRKIISINGHYIILEFYILREEELFHLDPNIQREYSCFYCTIMHLLTSAKKWTNFFIKNQISLINHTSYSHDLSSYDCFLFAKL